MSAPLRMTAHQVRSLAEALEQITKTTRDTGVILTAYGPLDVAVGTSTVRVGWDDEARAYVVDDRNGD